MRKVCGFICEFILAILLVSGQSGSVFTQELNLKHIKQIDLSGNKFHQVLFTQQDELFITMKNPLTGKWFYQIGKIRKEYLPCSNQEDTFGSISSDGTFFVISCPDLSVEVWNTKTARKLSSFKVRKKKDSKQLTSLFTYISPDGKKIVYPLSYRRDNTAVLRNAKTGRIIEELFPVLVECFFCGWNVSETVFSPDSKKVAVAHGALVSIFNAETGRLISQLRDPKTRSWDDVTSHGNLVSEILFSNDSKTIFTGSYDSSAKSWDVETGKLLHTFRKHRGRVWDLGVSPDNKILATGSTDDRVRLWNIETGELLLKTKRKGADPWRVRFSPDGKKFLSMTEEWVFIWDTASGKLLEKMKKFMRMSPNWKFVLIFNRKKNTLNLYEYQGNK